MLKKTITYTDYNDVERTEQFYFNLTKAELAKMELSVEGGMKERLENIVASKNQTELAKAFEQLIDIAYGEKSDDGRRIVKSKELSEAFKQTPAYDILYMELLSSSEAALDFLHKILPADLAGKALELSTKNA